MEKKITVKITLSGLPEAPNQHELAVALESEINDAVGLAICRAFEDGIRGKEWSVHVPSF